MKTIRMAQIRRVSQILFFVIFMFLLLNTEFVGSVKSSDSEISLPYPVGIFLEIDPLNAIATALATNSLYRNLLWSLVIIIPTLFLGRFFCGWMCPLGSINHFFGSLRSEKKIGKQRIESNRYKKWQSLKYYILVAVLLSALFGSQISGIMDPISLTVRSLSLSILPAINNGCNAVLDKLYQSDIAALQTVGDGLQFVLQKTIMNFKQPYFNQSMFIGLLFVLIIVLNLRITRFWCRAICPLGALLGLLSKWSIFGLQKGNAQCSGCNLCTMHCQGGDDPVVGAEWRKAECHLCFNCVGVCPDDELKFKFFPGLNTTKEEPDLTRRRVITSMAAGVALLPVLRSEPGLEVARNEKLIRPPGSLDEKHFLERCIRCGECMKVCPNNALQPTLMEAGLEGIWSPMLVPRIGYCEPSCTLCGEVCPTGAIWEFTLAEKKGTATNKDNSEKSEPIKLGTAFYDRGRCLPWAMAKECIVCEEWCPTSPKAIYVQTETVVDSDGKSHKLKRPFVNPERCIGCGACEHACPVQDRPAIYVTSIGESRSKSNQILLK